jgi:ComF family protein
MSLFAVKSNEKPWIRLFSDFTSLFFPEYCLGCSSGLVKGEEILCTRCILDLPRTGYQFDAENPVKEKFVGRLPIKHATAFLKFRKTGIVQHLLHQLKYNNHPEVGRRLGQFFGKEIKDIGLANEFDIIIPMPLHSMRQMKRGYNQSAMFAEGLMNSLGVPFNAAAVVRQVNTSTQTRKNKTERWENVNKAFSIKDTAIIKNKRVLLVDDIITTGASIEACGQELHNHGCKELSIACIAEAQ